jgi:hypothetical protein
MNNNDWVEFSGGDSVAKRRKPRVMLTGQKNFRLNRLAVEMLGNPQAVRFLFDAGQNRIGIRATEPDADNVFHVFKERLGQASIIRGSSFCKYYGIKPEQTVEFGSVRIDDDGTLILDLKTARRLA